MFSIALLASLLGLASAIDITAPAGNSTVTAGGTTTLTWSTVDTDPGTFSVYLVNFVDWPPSYIGIAYNVETSSGSQQVQIPCNTNPSYGYQLNAINGTNTYVIYAQSDKFSVSPSSPGCTDSGLPTPPGCGAASATTVTVTATPSTCFASNSSVTTTESSSPSPTDDSDSSSSAMTNPLQPSGGSPTDSTTLTPTDSSSDGSTPTDTSGDSRDDNNSASTPTPTPSASTPDNSSDDSNSASTPTPTPSASSPGDSSDDSSLSSSSNLTATDSPTPSGSSDDSGDDSSDTSVPSSASIPGGAPSGKGVPDIPISQVVPVSFGAVPGTIGWNPTGYSNPVTISPPSPTSIPSSPVGVGPGGAGQGFNPGAGIDTSDSGAGSSSTITTPPASVSSVGSSPTSVSPPISSFTGAAARPTGVLGGGGWVEVAAVGVGVVAMAL